MGNASENDGFFDLISGDDSLKNTVEEFTFPALGLFLYSLPAIILSLSNWISFQHELLPATVGVSVLFGICGVWFFAKHAGTSGGRDDPDYDTDVTKPQTTPPTFLPTSKEELDQQEFTEIERSFLLAEYEQVSEEGRYRDQLINRTNYFALATFVLLADVWVRVDTGDKPLVAVGASLAALTYVMAINKYKDARDPLWNRQRDIERFMRSAQGKLSTFHTIREPERRMFDLLSMSTYMINMYFLSLILSVLLYIGLVVEYLFTNL